ncbi:GTP-binding protein [Williamsia sp. CHRR-6]|uniref:CobW family GTP-binding protein n=1 Tax=Williamsia sp. CHRR-6 TaxID=2835871 RepID=UPI001BDA2171|nr:CobW family GTP-binding protein [Williamsia sp. CHRR-6]MBT0565578.1 GTP-binding protein [Williamsia sp. CHRR-6]
MSARRSVPVVVLAGFLGAGKTTVLNHFLRAARGARIGVLVNDFGAVSIDALLVAGAVDQKVTLGNGCICCSVDAESLEAVLADLVAPAAGLDVVVIEASGLAEPSALVRLVTSASSPAVAYGGLIYLLDGEQHAWTRARHPEVDRHIALADLVAVTKTDRMEAPDLDLLIDDVRQHNPTAAVLAVSHGQIDPAMIVDLPNRVDAGPRQLELADLLWESTADTGHDHDPDCADGHDHSRHAAPHLHADYRSQVLSWDGPLHPRRVAAFLERPPVGVYRIKGVVQVGVQDDSESLEVHAVGGHVGVVRHPTMVTTSQMMVIGAGMDPDAVTAAAADLPVVGAPPQPQAMLALTRYLAWTPDAHPDALWADTDLGWVDADDGEIDVDA